MQPEELVELLADLRQGSVDARHAYEHVVDKIEDKIMRDRLVTFLDNHKRHTTELTEKMLTLKQDLEVNVSQDIKGYILEMLASIGSAIDTKNGLRGLLPVEEMVNRRYREAVSSGTPEEVHEMLRKHFSDVKIHLDYITSNLQAV